MAVRRSTARSTATGRNRPAGSGSEAQRNGDARAEPQRDGTARSEPQRDGTARAESQRDGTARAEPAGDAPDRAARLLSLDRDDPSWVDARPFRAHLRHLMAVGSLEVTEVALVLGLPTRAVAALLEGRGGRPTRRISPHTARRLLLVGDAEVRGLRWCLTPARAGRAALARLHDGGWSDAEVALAVGFAVPEVAELRSAARCNRLLAVRLVGLVRSLPGTVDDQDLPLLVPAA